MIRLTRPVATLAVLAVLAGCQEKSSDTSANGGSTTSSSSGTTTTTTTTSTTTTGTTTMSLPGASTAGIALQTKGGMKMYDMVVGEGAEATSGKTVKVNYSGWLTDGTPFDSSVGKEPLTFTIDGGSFRVIDGWEQGIVGMKVGGKRKLVIPPDMGYGSQGSPPVIPPNATLVFDIELLDVH